VARVFDQSKAQMISIVNPVAANRMQNISQVRPGLQQQPAPEAPMPDLSDEAAFESQESEGRQAPEAS
jgi:hypothetical protein